MSNVLKVDYEDVGVQRKLYSFGSVNLTYVSKTTATVSLAGIIPEDYVFGEDFVASMNNMRLGTTTMAHGAFSSTFSYNQSTQTLTLTLGGSDVPTYVYFTNYYSNIAASAYIYGLELEN